MRSHLVSVLLTTLGIGLFLTGCGTPMDNTGPAGPPGAAGANGADGADGQLRIFGDGSAGELHITNNASVTLFQDVVLDGNLQFTNITVDAGSEFFLPSGVVLRCTGTFTNSGTMGIAGGSGTGGAGYLNGTSTVYGPPGPGISSGQAGAGAIGDNTAVRDGGTAGVGLIIDEAQGIYLPGVVGGGGGAGGVGGNGGPGGGTLVVLAKTSITNGVTGSIDASGGFGTGGGGGGAGGVIVLASPGSITNGGLIKAAGAHGGGSNTANGAGGGGSGGIVRMISPTITPGTVTVTGGVAGVAGAAASVSVDPHAGGGGGGACGGTGGVGGPVSTGRTPGAAGAGVAGFFIQTKVNPTALF